jgi:homopolymeric O-antigen transport system permease protein
MQSSALIYDSAERKWPIVHEATELIRYRDLMLQLISRNIKTRYKRSALGIVWTMLHPLMMMVVLTLAFASVFRVAVPHFAVYVLSGLLLWNFFSQTTNSAMSELLWGGTLLHRIYIPRGIFAATAVGTGLVNLLLSLPALFVVMAFSRVRFTAALLFVPVAILLTALFVMGVGLLLSTLVAYFADVFEMFQILLMSWFYLQPIMYPISIIPETLRWLIAINPMYYFLVIFRAPIYEGRLPSGRELGFASLIGIGTLAIGWLTFTRKADELAYRI